MVSLFVWSSCAVQKVLFSIGMLCFFVCVFFSCHKSPLLIMSLGEILLLVNKCITFNSGHPTYVVFHFKERIFLPMFGKLPFYWISLSLKDIFSCNFLLTLHNSWTRYYYRVKKKKKEMFSFQIILPQRQIYPPT